MLVWTEEPGGNNQHIVVQQTFTVAQDGTLTLGTPVQILPRPGEEPAVGDFSSYSVNLWGGPTTAELFLTVANTLALNSASGEEVKTFVIYDLNDPSSARELFREVDGVGNWACPAVPNPQSVPTCYNLTDASFNVSGTRLYWSDNRQDGQGDRWNAFLRMDVDMTGDLADWTFGDPEIVVTAPAGEGPGGGPPRPGIDRTILPDPEIIPSGLNIGSPTGVVRSRIFYDADQCAGLYAPFADGMSASPADLWMQCLDEQFVPGEPMEGNGSGGGDWQSPNTLLNVRPPESPAIYRFHVSGAMAGTEELLIENGENPDTNF